MRYVTLSGMSRYEEFSFSLDHVTLTEDFLPHVHDYIEMEIILSGTALNSINGRSFSAGAGDVFIVGEGATHEISQICQLELFNIGFHSGALRGIGQDLLTLPGFHALFLAEAHTDPSLRQLKLNKEELTQVQTLLEEMLQEYNGSLPGFQTVLMSSLSRLLVLLARKYSRKPPAGSSWQMASAAARMEREYAENLTIPALAESVFLSERHFRREFTRAYGVSPSAYLLNLRLEAACRLLCTGKHSVTDVALTCGFTDGNYFARVFHRRFGMTPSQYRRLQSLRE